MASRKRIFRKTAPWRRRALTRGNITLFGLLLVVAAALLTRERLTAPTAPPLNGQARVIDGDTVEIGETKIRFFGIDAPEMKQKCTDADGRRYPCGVRAQEALQAKIGGRPLACEKKDTDSYGRIVAVCRLEGADINGWMVANGWAVAYTRYAEDYAAAEAEARAAKRGLWSGRFENPARWRHRHQRQR